MEGPGKLKPDAGKSLVVFMRPTNFLSTGTAAVYDDLEYAGSLPGDTRFSYQTEPGEHMFMVIGENADFMKAVLAPDKTYYARVITRYGISNFRYGFVPFNGEPETGLQEWLKTTQPMVVNENGKEWAVENAETIKELHDGYLPVWLNKREDLRAKQTLLESSGR